MPDGECTVGVRVSTEIEAIRTDIERLDADNQRQWSALDKLRELLQRPPAWCAWAMTALGSVAGAAIGALVTIFVKGG